MQQNASIMAQHAMRTFVQGKLQSDDVDFVILGVVYTDKLCCVVCNVAVDACNEETSSACSSDSEDDQSTRGSSEPSRSTTVKRKQETTDGWSTVVDYRVLAVLKCNSVRWYDMFYDMFDWPVSMMKWII